MPWIEPLSLTLGVSIAKYALQSWLGEGLSATVGSDLLDVLKEKGEKALESRAVNRQIDQVGKKIKKQR